MRIKGDHQKTVKLFGISRTNLERESALVNE